MGQRAADLDQLSLVDRRAGLGGEEIAAAALGGVAAADEAQIGSIVEIRAALSHRSADRNIVKAALGKLGCARGLGIEMGGRSA
jgi:hypothetical protein